jgi:hypothetical protein
MELQGLEVLLDVFDYVTINENGNAVYISEIEVIPGTFVTISLVGVKEEIEIRLGPADKIDPFIILAGRLYDAECKWIIKGPVDHLRNRDSLRAFAASLAKNMIERSNKIVALPWWFDATGNNVPDFDDNGNAWTDVDPDEMEAELPY